MWSAEVAADDVWLALAAVEEPAGFGGELGLVAGPQGQPNSAPGVRRLTSRLQWTRAGTRWLRAGGEGRYQVLPTKPQSGHSIGPATTLV